MGYKATEAVMAHSQLKGPAYLLLLVIAHRINDEDGTWPLSIEDLKRDTKLSRAQVFAHIAEAKQAHELNSRRTGRKSVYNIPIYDAVKSPESQTSEVREPGHQDENNSPGIRTSDVRKPGHQKSGNPDISTNSHTFTSRYILKGAENGSISRPASPNGRGTESRRGTTSSYPQQPDWNDHGDWAWYFEKKKGEHSGES